MAGLKLQAVTKSWDGKTRVIKPLTLDVADGEFIVMVGPSGCGNPRCCAWLPGWSGSPKAISGLTTNA